MLARKELKSKAIKLRKEGYSYGIISQKVGVSKSTLSYWLKSIKYRPNKHVLERIKKGRRRALKARRERREKEKARIERTAKESFGTLTKRELKIAGAALYWGDGRKQDEIVRLVNSDPKMIAFFIRWLRNTCGVPKKNIKIEIHLYPDNNLKKTIEFWIKTTGIPKSQFLKTHIDKRKDKKVKKKGRLPFGTAHIYVNSGEKAKYGYRFFRQIQGWIEAIAESG